MRSRRQYVKWSPPGCVGCIPSCLMPVCVGCIPSCLPPGCVGCIPSCLMPVCVGYILSSLLLVCVGWMPIASYCLYVWGKYLAAYCLYVWGVYLCVPLMLFSAAKWIEACSEDAVYEGWKPVPGTITPGSVLNVHWVQAVCDPRENSGSRQGQQRALSIMVGCRCMGIHCITTVMQNCYITRN